MSQEQESSFEGAKLPLDYPSLDINSIDLDQSVALLTNTILDLFEYVEYRNTMIEKQKKQQMGQNIQDELDLHQDQTANTDQDQPQNPNQPLDNSNDDLTDLTKLKSNESLDDSANDTKAYDALVNNYKDITFKKVKLQQGYQFEDHLKDTDGKKANTDSQEEGDNNNECSDDNISSTMQNNDIQAEHDSEELKVKFKIDENKNTNEQENSESQKDNDYEERYTHDKINSLFKRFNLKKKPPISVHGYVKRLVKYLKVSTTVIVTASFYIYHLIYFPHEKHPWKRNDAEIEEEVKEEDETDFHHLKLYLDLTELNVHRIILTAFRISSKLIEDMNYNSKFFCQIVGIDKKWLLKLETIMLFLLNFDLKVDAHCLNSHFLKLKVLHDKFAADQS